MATQVELIFEKTCPNVEAARVLLLQAFIEAGLSPRWQEWEVGMQEAPSHIHGYGSPTILVNGRDVAGEISNGSDECCRLYSHGEGNKGVPPVKIITQALMSEQ